MRLRGFIWALVLGGGLMLTARLVAQTAGVESYALVEGSLLKDDCPICDRIPIEVPLSGTFGLRLTNQNSLFYEYEIVDVSFWAGTSSGPQYEVTGGGGYRVGGEVAFLQWLFLNLEINNRLIVTKALCANPDQTIVQKWPKLQLTVDQTNGTPGQVYYLTLVAVPLPKIQSMVLDPRTGNVELNWKATGGSYQVERASRIEGPYSPVTPITTNSSFTDPGALTNSSRYFYRLRLF